MRILISRLSSLGDVVCSLPVAVGFKKAFPDAEVTWLCQEPFAAIPRLCRGVDRTFLIKEGDRFDRARVRAEGVFDLALDLQGIWKSGALIGASRGRRKLGFHWQRELSWLFSERVLPDPTSLHVVDQYADVARAAGAEIERAEFGLCPDQEADAGVGRILADHGVGAGEKLAIFNVASRWAAKDWPIQNYLAVGRQVVEAGAKVVLVGAAEGVGSAQMSQELGDRAADLGGKTSVTEVVSLIARATVHVGGDTGTGHIAAALGVPAVAVHTTTSVARSCPYGQTGNCVGLDPVLVGRRVKEILEGP